jgi:hypothetical protein
MKNIVTIPEPVFLQFNRKGKKKASGKKPEAILYLSDEILFYKQ